MRKLLIAAVGIVVVLGAAALVAPGLIDWTEYKPQIQQAARDATGRELVIDGDISLSLIPSPTLSVGGVRLANIDGGTDASMVSLETLDVNVALWPLISGTVQVSSVTLVRPVIVLETLADGTNNWTFDTASSGASPTRSSDAGGGTAVSGFALDRADIEDGQVVYRDRRTGAEYQLAGIDMSVSAGGLSGPFDLDGSFAYRGVPVAVVASVGEIDSGRAAAVKLEVAAGDAAVTANLSGAVGLGDETTFKGRVEIAAESLQQAAALAPALGIEAPTGLPDAGMTLQTALDGTTSIMAARDLILTIDGARFQGSAEANLVATPAVELKLTGNRLDLDALLEGSGEAAPTDDAPAAAAPDAATAPDAPSGLVLPTAVDLRVEARIDAIQYRGAPIRNAQIDASLKSGVADLRLATAQLPGGTDVTVLGGVENTLPPVFRGRLEAASNNLRATLDWLGVDLAGVPADRLRKAALSAAIDVSEHEISIGDWSMEVDATRAQGGLTLVLRERPAFGLSLAVDRINLDAYQSAAPADTEPGAAAGGTDEEGTEPRNPLAALAAFDANVDLRVGEATVMGVPITDARVDALLQSGTLTFREFRVADLAGARGTISGQIREVALQPVVDLRFDLAVEDTDRFSRFLSVDVPIPPAQLGRVSFVGTAAGDGDQVALNAKLAAAGGTLAVSGSVRPLAIEPAVDLTYALAHPDANRLISVLAPGSLDNIGSLGAVQAKGRVRTLDAGQQEVSLAVSTAGGQASLSGTVSPLVAEPSLSIAVEADHPDTRDLVRLLAPDYRLRDAAPQPLRFAARLDGPTVSLSARDIALSVGAAEITGEGTIAISDPRPAVTLDLQTGRIDLTPWMPADQAAPQGGAAAAAVPVPVTSQDWGRDPIDTSALSAIDGDFQASLEAVVLAPYEVDNLSVRAALKDGVLDVSELTGGLFGGTVSATASLADRPTPEVAAKLSVRDADVRAVAATAGQTDTVSGILSSDADLRARGVSEYDLVSTLAGQGSVDIRDGTVQGFDLRAFSDRLQELNGVTDFLDLTQRALQGGETAFRSLTGTYTVTQWVLRSNDIALDADAAVGQATAVIDLPPRQMDVIARASLTDHPKAPPVGIRLVGPIDNPRRILDIDEMQRHVVQRIGTSTLRQLDRSGTLDRLLGPADSGSGAGGDSGTDSGADAAPTETDEPVRPEDAVRGLLRGLINR